MNKSLFELWFKISFYQVSISYLILFGALVFYAFGYQAPGLVIFFFAALLVLGLGSCWLSFRLMDSSKPAASTAIPVSSWASFRLKESSNSADSVTLKSSD